MNAFLGSWRTSPLGRAQHAIDAVMRVKITDEALALMDPAVGDRLTRLTAALAELGFEVEE
jgi:hypothetical protein